jgi:predicted ATPase/DNA-binding CsgD family transcriptional regulator
MHESLTEREREILRLIAEGQSNDDIARALTLTVGTVKWYNTQIFGKLGVRNRTEAVAQARRWGIDTGDDVDADAATLEPLANLPVQAMPFTGRARELAELDTLLHDPRHRLITLVGPGGIGKTRLAVALAERSASHFADGVTFVGLSSLRTNDPIAPAIAAALGLRLAEGNTPAQQIMTHLRWRQMLLILDNFDLLLSNAAFAAQLVRSAPGLRVLITSRERLNVLEETVYRVNGMTLPAHDDDDETALQTNEAVRLFLYQAAHVRPDFVADAAALQHIAHICRIVEGMPLALILAATWVEMLTPAEIAQEIMQHVDFLATELRDIPERHQSLRAVWTSTWAQMSTSEQQAFARMTVFRGGFTRAAAVAVLCSDLHTLMALVHKSLVRREEDGRYSLHELLRQFAQEQHEMMHDAAYTHGLHSAYYLALLDAAQPDLRHDLENMRAAWLWALETGDHARAEVTLMALYHLYAHDGRFLEVRNLLEDALGYAGLPAMLRRRLHDLRGSAHFALGDFDSAITDFNRVFDEAKAAGDEDWQRMTLVALGKVYRRAERHEDAKRALNAAITQARAQDDQKTTARALYHLGTVYWSEGENQPALACHREAHDIAQRLGLRDLTATQALHGLGEALLYAGEPSKAHESFLAAYEIASSISNLDQIAENLEMIGWALLGTMGLGDNRGAAEYFHRALEFSEKAQMSWHTACTLHGLAAAQAADGDYVSAIATSLRGLELSEVVGVSRFTAMGLDTLGMIYQDLGRFTEAEALHSRAITILLRQEWVYWLPRLYANLAIDRLRSGNLDVGKMLREALDLAVTSAQIVHVLRPLEGLAELHLALGEAELTLGYADQLLAIAQAGGLRQAEASARYWRGEALMALGLGDEAKRELSAALALIAQVEYRLMERLIREAYARCLTMVGEREAAAGARAAASRVVLRLPRSDEIEQLAR